MEVVWRSESVRAECATCDRSAASARTNGANVFDNRCVSRRCNEVSWPSYLSAAASRAK